MRRGANVSQVFERLRKLRECRLACGPGLEDSLSFEIAVEVGHAQDRALPLSLKQLLRLDIASAATVQRRVARLKELGLVLERRAAGDGRVLELTLSPAAQRRFARLAILEH